MKAADEVENYAVIQSGIVVDLYRWDGVSESPYGPEVTLLPVGERTLDQIKGWRVTWRGEWLKPRKEKAE